MPAAPRPFDDETRVLAVRRHLRPEDGRDDGLQAIGEAAARMVGVPVALVSLVDAEEQFFGGCVGLDADRTPREHAFCGYTILQNALLEVPDARQDARFRDNPLVTGPPNIMFYAGAPLESACGQRLGTLCLIDFQPRILSNEQRERLLDLATAGERVLCKLNALRQANAELQVALDKAREADRAKSAFLACMSHELRTPLNSVLGFAEVLESHLSRQQDSQHAGYARDIRESGDHLMSLINDVLDVSRLEAGRHELYPEEFDVQEQLTWAARMIAPRSEAAGVTVETAVARGVETLIYDPRAFRQILLNLVGNAVKYAGRGARVEVSAEATPAGVRVQVSDDGPGIAEDAQTGLFQPFARGESHSLGGREGSGLGLCLCKGLAELAGGTIELESRPGAGTRVSVEMPDAGRAPGASDLRLVRR